MHLSYAPSLATRYRAALVNRRRVLLFSTVAMTFFDGRPIEGCVMCEMFGPPQGSFSALPLSAHLDRRRTFRQRRLTAPLRTLSAGGEQAAHAPLPTFAGVGRRHLC